MMMLLLKMLLGVSASLFYVSLSLKMSAVLARETGGRWQRDYLIEPIDLIELLSFPVMLSYETRISFEECFLL